MSSDPRQSDSDLRMPLFSEMKKRARQENFDAAHEEGTRTASSALGESKVLIDEIETLVRCVSGLQSEINFLRNEHRRVRMVLRVQSVFIVALSIIALGHVGLFALYADSIQKLSDWVSQFTIPWP